MAGKIHSLEQDVDSLLSSIILLINTNTHR